MHFSTNLCLLVFSLLLSTAISADPLFHFCFSPENFTVGSPYGTNLNALFTLLTSNVPPTGFNVGSVGKAPNRVTGLGLCRGDVKAADCRTCIAAAGKELQARCPTYKGSVIWYDNCELKYSDEDFLGRVDKGNKFYMWNTAKVANPKVFNNQTKELLLGLAGDAVSAARKTYFATGDVDIELEGKQQKLYGLVQCTRDLRSDDCSSCLGDAIDEIGSCCDGKRGGRVVGPNCNFRYELYPFVNSNH